jgi:ArsR family transcriptional regulator, arsenate/arsenite/antimonite-responsive transcriptional repressor
VLTGRVAVLILDDIDICQYIGHMKRQTDPDVLLLQAAADPTRLAILRQLSDCAEVCACDFTACCDVSQPTVSHHLKVLRDAGWIDGERRGTWIFYTLRPQAVARFRELAGGLGTAITIPAPTARRLPVLEARA